MDPLAVRLRHTRVQQGMRRDDGRTRAVRIGLSYIQEMNALRDTVPKRRTQSHLPTLPGVDSAPQRL
jgi:hypothetical protein